MATQTYSLIVSMYGVTQRPGDLVLERGFKRILLPRPPIHALATNDTTENVSTP